MVATCARSSRSASAARRGAEDRQRAVLGGDDRGGQIDVHVIRTPGGHERELVQRQLPGHAGRRYEREAVHVAALDVLDQPVQGLIHATVVDRDRVLVARNGAGPERQDEYVVLERLPGLGVHDMLVGLDPVELVGDQLGARVRGDRRQRDSAARFRRRTARGPSSADTTNSSLGASTVVAVCSGASSLSASAASRPATPPPTITTRSLGWEPCVVMVNPDPGGGAPAEEIRRVDGKLLSDRARDRAGTADGG